jgi:stearoyl-CoA desaturase (delta-9 desaturase)
MKQQLAAAESSKFIMKWPTFIGIAGMHLGLIFAPSTFNWPAFAVFLFLNWVTLGLGVTLGYHRLLSHRSFKATKGLEHFLSLCGALAAQGGPMKWVSTHRVHHAFSDRPQDPHSPRRGFWWAHMGWLFAYDEILDHPTDHWRYAPEIAADPVHRFISDRNILLQIALGLILFMLGGWPFVVWGIFVRIVFCWHCTWFVNSICHIWGYQNYDTGEDSKNNPWLALLTYGDGWHNNHHAYPTSAAHGLRWWEFDIGYWTIRLFTRLGLSGPAKMPQGNPTKLPKAHSLQETEAAYSGLTVFANETV